MAAIGINQTTLTILIGIAPSLIWLFFWQRLTRNKRKPIGPLFLCFVLGGASVFFATFLQNGFKDIITNPTLRIIMCASIEEVLKFAVFYTVAYKISYNNETLGPALYLIVAALGFAAVENILYALQPAANFTVSATLLTAVFRFFGSTLLHATASCFIGIILTMSSQRMRQLSIAIGISGAIFLHSTFNFFILKNDTASFLQIYGYLWIIAIISYIILERFRRYPSRALAAPL